VPTVRPAKPSDAETIAVIFNQGVEDRVATFETSRADAAR
jgi:L-amino acid N-acyltransferase YncA